jgi:uncharacterized membrane protein YeiH
MQTPLALTCCCALMLGQLCLCVGQAPRPGLTLAAVALCVGRCWTDILLQQYSVQHVYARAALAIAAAALVTRLRSHLARFHDYHAEASGLVLVSVFGADTAREAWALWTHS